MSKELLQGLGSVKTNGTSCVIEGNYLLFTGKIWPTATELYIPIQNCTNIFEYDIIYESDAGNYFYVGIERYDTNKATGSNSCTQYKIATQNVAKTKQRVKGTIDLNQTISSENQNKTAYIRLRVLNNWTSSTAENATAKIYHLSLRELTENTNKNSINTRGQMKTDQFRDDYDNASITKTNVNESNTLYEY